MRPTMRLRLRLELRLDRVGSRTEAFKFLAWGIDGGRAAPKTTQRMFDDPLQL